jgi:hypothetical protein
MGRKSSELRRQGLELIARAQRLCDHANHQHDYDPDGPGYTCNDCGKCGEGDCPDEWPCPSRGASAASAG